MNRETLLSDLNTYFARGDLSRYPLFIRIAHSKINRDTTVRSQDTTDIITVGSDGRAPLPEDYSTLRSLDQLAGEYVPAEVAKGFKDRPVGSGQRFTIEGSDVVTYPALEANTALSILYTAKLPALVAASDTNWVLSNAYDVYFFAVASIAARVTGDIEEASSLEGMYKEAVGSLNRAENRGRYLSARLILGGSSRETV